MLHPELRQQITSLVRHWVVPAIGCTEPICVALATAKAAEILGTQPTKIDVFLSANILKNAMGVGIPGTGMVGLPIAIALGALIGKSAYGLEVIKDCTPETVEKASSFIKEAGYTFPVYYDVYLEASTVFGATSLPMTFFIDKEGSVAAFARGKIGISDIEAGIELILKK